jgi:hypothetical protein
MNDGTEAKGIARLANFRLPTDDEIQRGIDDCMRGVIASAGYNPNAFRHPGEGSAIPAGAVKAVGLPDPSPGWQPEVPFQPPGGATAQTIIERMCNAALPQPKPQAKGDT